MSGPGVPVLRGELVTLRPAEPAYRRVGFRPVGVMRRHERGADGTWHDGLLMDLLPEELT